MQHPWWNSSVTFPHSCTIRYIPESAHHAELNCTHGGIFSEVSWNGVQMHCQQTISTCWWRAKVHLCWIKEVFVFCKCENHIKSEHIPSLCRRDGCFNSALWFKQGKVQRMLPKCCSIFCHAVLSWRNPGLYTYKESKESFQIQHTNVMSSV